MQTGFLRGTWREIRLPQACSIKTLKKLRERKREKKREKKIEEKEDELYYLQVTLYYSHVLKQ